MSLTKFTLTSENTTATRPFVFTSNHFRDSAIGVPCRKTTKRMEMPSFTTISTGSIVSGNIQNYLLYYKDHNNIPDNTVYINVRT
jgi:hypothetical protein